MRITFILSQSEEDIYLEETIKETLKDDIIIAKKACQRRQSEHWRERERERNTAVDVANSVVMIFLLLCRLGVP